jgi:hypothetical protein
MPYTDFLTPRPEVLSEDGIEGIIDLANLDDPKQRKLEARPGAFLGVTYPTADVRRVLDALHRRFSGDADAPGLFLFEGLKGSGKSHLLLLMYHLFNSPEASRPWLRAYGLTCAIPADSITVINKFTDLPLSSIWDFIFGRISGQRPPTSIVQPSLKEVKRALDGRRLILILDELEQGIRIIGDPAVKAQNLAFLQMLTEWANRENQVTLFASIYSDQEEPGSTLMRLPSCRVQFGLATDRSKVVLHRLFENFLSFQPDQAGPIADSYVNVWRRHLTFNADEFRARMLQSYPLSPDLLEILLRRIPARGGFQNVRGALGFLAHLVRLTHTQTDLITPAHTALHDREVGTRLADLDTSGDLIAKARGNLEDLKSYPLATEVASTVMLYTLAGTPGRTLGATREELLRSILAPGIDINELERTLLAFQKYASHFHVQEGRYLFDPEENADAKVEFKSLLVSDNLAKSLLQSLWRDEIFREPTALIYADVNQSKVALEGLDKDRLRFVLAPRRLTPDERHTLYHGLSVRNQVILLEPRDGTFNIDTHADLLKWAKRLLAAKGLIQMTSDASRCADYERIIREDRKHMLDGIRRAGLVYLRVDRYGPNADEDRTEEELLGAASSREEVVNNLSQQLFPPDIFIEHLRERLETIKERTVKEIDQEYRATLGFPVPTHASSVTKAIRFLCKSATLGIYHPRGNYCREDPPLNEAELLTAMIGDPLDVRVAHGGSVSTLPQPIIAPPPGVGPEVPAPPRPICGESIDLPVPPQTSIGALRQEIASRLQAHPEAKIVRARFTVYLEQITADLSTLPASLRGSLSGSGALAAEIKITKEGEYSKVEIEQMVEKLPSLPQARYSARLDLIIPARPTEVMGHA